MNAKTRPLGYLRVVIRSGGTGRLVPVYGSCDVGRSPSAGVYIRDRAAAARHVYLQPRDLILELTCLDPRGFEVPDGMVREGMVRLMPGDWLRIGAYELLWLPVLEDEHGQPI